MILNLFIYLFIYGCVGSSFLCEGLLQLRQVGATLHRGAWASHYRGLSCCGAQAPDAQAQQLWLTGLVAPWHVGSSQTRARTRVPCIGRHRFSTTAPPGKPHKIFYLQFFKYPRNPYLCFHSPIPRRCQLSLLVTTKTPLHSILVKYHNRSDPKQRVTW